MRANKAGETLSKKVLGKQRMNKKTKGAHRLLINVTLWEYIVDRSEENKATSSKPLPLFYSILSYPILFQ